MKLYYPQNHPVAYSADLHLGHGNIILYCLRKEFMTPAECEMADAWYGDGKPREKKPKMSRETIQRHDEAIIANINTIVPHDGILAIVGDFSMMQDRDVIRRYRERITSQFIHLVLGNHDLPNVTDIFQWVDQKRTVVVSGHDTSCFGLASHVVLDHEAHWFWDGRHKGSRHYYGHTHAMGEEELDRLAPGRFSIDVGVDNAMRLLGERRPFKDVELEAIMTKRSGFGAYIRERG